MVRFLQVFADHFDTGPVMSEKILNRARLVALAACVTLAACGGTKNGEEGSTSPAPTGSNPPAAAPALASAPSPAPAPPAQTPTPSSAVLHLPIEVLGTGAPDAPTIVSTDLPLDASAIAQAAQLALVCHRCGLYNSPEYRALSKPATKVAGSLRIVGAQNGTTAPWIDISDATIAVPDVERSHGGVNGGLLTIRFSVPIDATTRSRLLVSTGNRIEFRFNSTDGSSNGYRILDVQVQDASGKNLLSMRHQWADVGAEKTAGREASADATLGQALWNGQNLLTKSSIVDTTIRAACASWAA